MKKPSSDWDEKKDLENQAKHGVSFSLARHAFLDPLRVIAEDVDRSSDEIRFYCMGKVGEGIITVRFTHRGDSIRNIGAGDWRKGKRIYEKENKIHR